LIDDVGTADERPQRVAGAQPSKHTASASSVPWFDGSMPITSSTMARMSGQNFSTHRGSIPPWLKPTIDRARPSARACVVRSA
jgi:hypothetical protein